MRIYVSIGKEVTEALECGIGFQPVVVGTQAGSLCHLFPPPDANPMRV